MSFLTRVGVLILVGVSFTMLAAVGGEQMTIYSQGFAEIAETRSVSVAAETWTVSLQMPSGLIPESLWIEAIAPVVSFSYRYVPVSSILTAMVGRDVEVIDGDGMVERGTLLGQTDGVVLKNAAGTITVIKDVAIVQLADGQALDLGPRIDVTLDSTAAGPMALSLLYLSQGLSWSANYIAIIAADETETSLAGTVLLTNNSGFSYAPDEVSLIAGDLNVSTESLQPSFRAMALAVADTSLVASAASEYYRYPLPQPVDLPDGASIFIPYTASTAVGLQKTYRYEPAMATGVQILLTLENTNASGLGVPLPAGEVRVYQQEEKGRLFIGQDRIPHTAVGDTIVLSIGSAFDLSGERVVTARRRISDGVQQQDVTLTLTNRKDQPVKIVVFERPQGPVWKILSSSMTYEVVDASTIRFDVTVPAGGEASVTYTSESSS